MSIETENFPENFEKIEYDSENQEIRVITKYEEHIYEWQHGIPLRQID